MLADARNMASYPPNFIPIVEAFDQAVAALAPAKIAGQEKGPNDAYSVLSTLNREQIRGEIEVWNAGGGLSHELAKAVIQFEKQRHFPDFKWRFDPTIQEELLDSIELQLRGSNEYRDLSKAELVDFEDEFEEPAQRVYEAERKVERLFRDALAGGPLDPWVNGRQGMELLSDRESWRPGALGVPGFEPRTHHLTNPGPNEEREVFIERGQLKAWIAMTATRQPTDAELDDAIRKTVGPDGRAPSQNKCAEIVRQTYPQVTRDRVRGRYPHVLPGLKQGRGCRKKCAS
jgi:hypothetical protein